MRHRYVRALLLSAILLCPAVLSAGPKLTKPTLDAWTNYIDLTEKRIAGELLKPSVDLHFRIADLKSGGIPKERLTTKNPSGEEIEIPDGAVHHWIGAVFIPGKTLAEVIPWLQNYSQYQEYFKDVERSSLNRPPAGDAYDVFLRFTRSKLTVTAHFNTRHNVVYTRKNATFVSSASRSTEIRQVADAGKSTEKEYPEGDDSGYLWRLNSYWRFFERDGGVIVECETVGLSRSLGWGYDMVKFVTFGAINPRRIATQIARDALDDTLKDLRNGVNGGPKKPARK